MHPRPWRARIAELAEDLRGPKVEGGHILSLSELQCPPFSALRSQSSWLSGLQTLGPTPVALSGSKAFRPGLSYNTGFPGSPACRRQPARLLGLHNL